MAAVGIDLQSALLVLITQIRRAFADLAWLAQLPMDPATRREWLAASDRAKSNCEIYARDLEECARMAPKKHKATLFDAAARLGNLDREVPTILANVLAALSEAPARQAAADAVDDVNVKARYKPPNCPKCNSKAIVRSAPKTHRELKCTNEECGHTWKKARP